MKKYLFFFIFMLIYFYWYDISFSKALKVGIYNNSPKVFLDNKNMPAGFLIDITNEIAKMEKIDIYYVYDEWEENLKKLEKGELDCVLDMSYTPERAEKFTFNSISVLESWIQAYGLKDQRISKIEELNNKKIAVLNNSLQHKYIEKLKKEKGINCDIFTFETHEKAVKKVLNKNIDVFIGGRFFYFSKNRPFEIEAKPLILNETKIYYGFRKDIDPEIVSKFDRAIFTMKNDYSSIYYQSQKRWFNIINVSYNKIIFQWVLIILAILVFIILIFIIANMKLKQEVKLRTAEIEKTKAYFEAIFNNSPDAIFIHDGNTGNILDVNDSMCKIYNCKKEDIIGKDVEYISANEGIYTKEYALKMLEKSKYEGNQTFEWKGKKFTGEVFWVEVNISFLNFLPDSFYIVLVRDISQRKKAEEEVLKTKKELEIANKVKSQFLANMSHEIRTPLNGVIGMLEILSQTELTREQLDYIDYIKLSADNLLNIINDILDISNLEFGKIKEEKICFNIEESIEEILKNVKKRYKDKNLNVIKNISNDFLSKIFEGDKNMVEKILANLIDNSFKFTEEGNVTINILKNKENNFVRIEVMDTGIGMSEETIKSIFQSFVQGDISYEKKYQGTGLGLAIAKKLTEIMQGNIWVESELGKGSKFYVELPLKEIKVNLNENNVKSKINKILIVEDNNVNLEVIKKMLEKIGKFEIISAENGMDGIKKYLENEGVDLIFMDIQMPVLNGFDAFREIIKISIEKNYKKPIFVAMTAYAMVSDKQKCLEIGMDYYLSKPFFIKDVQKILDEINK